MEALLTSSLWILGTFGVTVSGLRILLPVLAVRRRGPRRMLRKLRRRLTAFMRRLLPSFVSSLVIVAPVAVVFTGMGLFTSRIQERLAEIQGTTVTPEPSPDLSSVIANVAYFSLALGVAIAASRSWDSAGSVGMTSERVQQELNDLEDDRGRLAWVQRIVTDRNSDATVQDGAQVSYTMHIPLRSLNSRERFFEPMPFLDASKATVEGPAEIVEITRDGVFWTSSSLLSFDVTFSAPLVLPDAKPGATKPKKPAPKEAKDEVEAPAESDSALRARLHVEISEIETRWSAYDTDLSAILRRPMMRDLDNAAVDRVVRGLAKVRRQRDDGTDLRELGHLVDELRVDLDKAERAADRSADSVLPADEREHIEKARELLRALSDDGLSEHERALVYERLKKRLSSLSSLVLDEKNLPALLVTAGARLPEIERSFDPAILQKETIR